MGLLPAIKTIGGISGASYGDDVDKAIASGLFVVDRDSSAAAEFLTRALPRGRSRPALTHDYGMCG